MCYEMLEELSVYGKLLVTICSEKTVKISKNLHEFKQNRQFFQSRKSSTEFHFPVPSCCLTLFKETNMPHKENFLKTNCVDCFS